MHTVRHDVDRPSPETVAAFDGLPSTVVSDAMGRDRRAMDAEIGPVARGTTLAGTALTVKAQPGDNLVIHKAITMADPGDVLVVDGDGYLGTAYMGELMCTACRTHDIAGVVVDGAIRDCADIEAMDYPVFARGVHPQGPLKVDPGSINVTVACGGIPVEPGDIVVGDDDGVTVVPRVDAGVVADRAREKLEGEDDKRERIAGGEYPYEMSGHNETFEAFDEIEIVGQEPSPGEGS